MKLRFIAYASVMIQFLATHHLLVDYVIDLMA